MSLKGNVAGLGLGELLQSLVRGGRDGALTLYGDGLHAVIGFQDGLMHLLANEDESHDTLSGRVRDAWADEGVGHVQKHVLQQRLEAVAHSARLETLYRMLESSNLHFSFRPGHLSQFINGPSVVAGDTNEDASETIDLSVGGPPKYSPSLGAGPGLSVEYVLLEHARLSDEAGDQHDPRFSPYAVPLAIDPASAPAASADFLAHCNGASSIQEIADRFGWPARQCIGSVRSQFMAGNLRVLESHELLGAAQRELDLSRTDRAGSRIVGWLSTDHPGPLVAGAAQLLVAEWESGRLPLVVQTMPNQHARMLLRRLDLSHQDRRAMVARWGALYESDRTNPSVGFRYLALRAGDASLGSESPVPDLLRLARTFREQGNRHRATVTLRIAAELNPSKLNHRAELGSRLVELGHAEEASRWVLAAAREMISADQGDKAAVILKALIENGGSTREARQLLHSARNGSAHSRKRRRNSLVGVAIVLLFSGAALVQVRRQQGLNDFLDRIHLMQPAEGIAAIEERYVDSELPTPVQSQYDSFHKRLAREDERIVESWQQGYEQALLEVRQADPFIGLRMGLNLERPHTGGASHSLEGLFGAFLARVEARSNATDFGLDGTIEQERAEDAFVDEIEATLHLLDAPEIPDAPELDTLRAGLESALDKVTVRRENRAEERSRIAESAHEEELNVLLADARRFQEEGRIEEAHEYYERFVSRTDDADLLRFIEPERRAALEHYQAYTAARERALAGDHEEAWELLNTVGSNGEKVCPNPSNHKLPWRVESLPTGAVATFENGTRRVTPFTMDSAFGEVVRIRFTLDSSETRTIGLESPHDLLVKMHARPARQWDTRYRVSALPVPYQDDHILCDRSGAVVRMAHDGELVWRRDFETLGGIAVAPVFLPSRSGHMLVVSEDGQAWVVDARTGDTEGPWEAGSPLQEGPVVFDRGVLALFRDGSVAKWSEGLEPEVFQSVERFRNAGPGSSRNAGLLPIDPDIELTMVSLVRGAEANTALTSPWTDWTAAVFEDEFRFERTGSKPVVRTAARKGDWNWVAWEMHDPTTPNGRLWISDESGVRAYEPED
jgi:hypothetical protein